MLPPLCLRGTTGQRQYPKCCQYPTVGSYQTTLSIGGIFPVKKVQAVITPRQTVTVCGNPFRVKMFSEGALIVGFTDINGSDGVPVNSKEAGLRLGDAVICIGDTSTESNDEVKRLWKLPQANRSASSMSGRTAATDNPYALLGCRRQ